MQKLHWVSYLSDLIKIHLGDATDAKSLLGTYVCTAVPGEYEWKPGALSQAVTEGRWILIEDIDLAPTDVLSVLLPLLESRKLFIPGRGLELQAAEGFQIFGTRTLRGMKSLSGSTLFYLLSYCKQMASTRFGT